VQEGSFGGILVERTDGTDRRRMAATDSDRHAGLDPASSALRNDGSRLSLG